jgi:hypothetical protein
MLTCRPVIFKGCPSTSFPGSAIDSIHFNAFGIFIKTPHPVNSGQGIGSIFLVEENFENGDCHRYSKSEGNNI